MGRTFDVKEKIGTLNLSNDISVTFSTMDESFCKESPFSQNLQAVLNPSGIPK
jgi:hypothetical protein